MSDAVTLQKLRKAHIPPYALTANFTTTNLLDLKARMTSKAVVDSSTPINFYVHAGDNTKAAMRRVCVAVGIMAKALCIQDRPIIHVTIAGMLRESRFNEMEREARSYNPVMSQIGKGYIAIGDFLEFADVEQKYGYHAAHLVGDHLIEHIELGGGLILGATNIDIVDAHQYGAAFAAVLQSNFESYRVL